CRFYIFLLLFCFLMFLFVYLVYFLFFFYESGLVYLCIISLMGLCCESGVLFV
ncbi:hypothetical protein BGX38DRAFT_1246449, partial [Terfezia claveryi]